MSTKSEQLNKLVERHVNSKRSKDVDIENNDFNIENQSDNSDVENNITDEKLSKQHYVAMDKSRLRDQFVDDNNELKVKYTGKIGSRSEMFNSNNDNDNMESHTESEENESTSSENEEIENEEEVDDELISESDDNSISETDEEISSESESASESEVENDKREKISSLVQKETKNAINKLSSITKSDSLKGYAILKQQTFFENIIDIRIKLQKILMDTNKLPLTKESKIKFESNNHKLDKHAPPIFHDETKINKKLLNIFNDILEIRAKVQNDDNISNNYNFTRKRSINDLYTDMDNLDNDLKNFRKNVLNKWSNKINMASGNSQLNNNKFKSINQSANTQVENQLADLPRLLKRTKLNRSNVLPFNFNNDLKKLPLLNLDTDKNSSITDENSNDDDNIDIPKNYDPRRKDNIALDLTENPYIFDDEDFYRVLLNDLLDKKLFDSSNNNNNTSNSNNSKEIMLRTNNINNNKLKKNIDTKASKGRKLNYSVQEPIANYEAPINSGYKWSDEQIDEFFAGLLGQKINFDENDLHSDSESNSKIDNNDDDELVKNDDIQIFG